MIFENAKPRMERVIEKANNTKENQEVTFIYNELMTKDSANPIFEFLFSQGIDFATRHGEYRFVVIIFPKSK